VGAIVENENKLGGTTPNDITRDTDQGRDLRSRLKKSVPAELLELSQRGARRSKDPVNPKTGANAKVSDRENPKKARDTWGTVDESASHAERNGLDGVGFVFSEDDPYCGVDLDDCRDPDTGKIEGWAQEIIDSLASYTEVSPSGTGVHVISRGVLPRSGNKKGQIEMYDSGRYFTVTGRHLKGTPRTLRSAQQALLELHRKAFGDPDNSDGLAPTLEDNIHIPKAIRKLEDEELLRRILRSRHNLQSLPVALPVGEQLEDRPLRVRGSHRYFPHPPPPVAADLVADAERATCFQADHQPVRHDTVITRHEPQML
jgi:hypothetical protein